MTSLSKTEKQKERIVQINPILTSDQKDEIHHNSTVIFHIPILLCLLDSVRVSKFNDFSTHHFLPLPLTNLVIDYDCNRQSTVQSLLYKYHAMLGNRIEDNN